MKMTGGRRYVRLSELLFFFFSRVSFFPFTYVLAVSGSKS